MLRYAPRPRTRREGLTDDQSETISRAFVTFDSDRSGSIERNELEKVLHYLGFELDDDLLSYKMAITDTDGSGRIEKGEFVEMMSSIFLNSTEPGSTAYNPQLACTLTRRQARAAEKERQMVRDLPQIEIDEADDSE